MSSPTMMICLRKARIGEGVSGRLVLGFYLVFFFFGGEAGSGGGQTAFITCTWSAHTCRLRPGEIEWRIGTKCLENLFGEGCTE